MYLTAFFLKNKYPSCGAKKRDHIFIMLVQAHITVFLLQARIEFEFPGSVAKMINALLFWRITYPLYQT